MSFENLNILTLPSDLRAMAEAVRNFEKSRSANSQPPEKITRYRLRLAIWICLREKLEPSLDNLAVILGTQLRDAVPFLDETKKEMGL